jgi:hypothetical protein
MFVVLITVLVCSVLAVGRVVVTSAPLASQ